MQETDTRSRVLTGTVRGYVDEFDEALFTSVNRNTTWLDQVGGPRIRRWDGVKSAINAIVNDTTLTTGAYFGFPIFTLVPLFLINMLWPVLK